MKNRIALLLALLTIFLTAAVPFAAGAEEEAGLGRIVFVDVTDAEDEIPDEIPDTEPFVPGETEKMIFGSDNRVKVINTKKYPFSAIASMYVMGYCGHFWTGSGFMVAGDKMLTAAHCLICPTCSQWAKTITFYFGYKSPTNYLYRYTGSWTGYVGTTFRNHRYTIMNDYGVVKFNAAVGSKTGWFGAKWNSSNKTLNNKTDYVAGYHNGILKYGKGKVFVYDAAHLKYSIDTQKGTSGGPVYNSSRYALGINIAESSVTNLAHRLTKAVYRLYLH